MDRNLVYPGSIPLDTDLLAVNRNTMIALGYLAQIVLGIDPVVDGLACVPTSPPSMTITVGPGTMSQLSVIDMLPYGSLPADTIDPLLKLGVNIAPSTFALTAPTTSGQAVNYLIEATFQESDVNPIVLPYYNAAQPSQPYSGPANSAVPQNTLRTQSVELQVKCGACHIRNPVYPARRQRLDRTICDYSPLRQDVYYEFRYPDTADSPLPGMEAALAASGLRLRDSKLHCIRNLYRSRRRFPGGGGSLGGRIRKLRIRLRTTDW